MKAHMEGLVAAPHTPMDEAGGLALSVIEKQAESIARNGVVGAFICGTTGEGMSLSVDERFALAERWTAAAPKALRVIVQVGHTSLEAAQTMAAHAQKVGAWGIGALAPFFYRPQLAELVDFCAAIARMAPKLPFYYYHLPSFTGVDVRIVDFLTAAGEKIPNLAGVKFTHEDLMDYGLCCRLQGGRFDMLYGRDETLLCGLALGANGAVGSTYNYMAPLYLRLIEAFGRGDLDAARALQEKSMNVVRLLHKYAPGTSCGKAIMKIAGIDCGPPRPPLRKLGPQEHRSLQEDLEAIGFFEFCTK